MRRPTSPRIAPTDQRPPSITAAMKAHNVRATLATNPTVAAGMAAMGRALLQQGTIPPRARELVILRMGWNCQSRYEFGQHTLMARTVGVSDDETSCSRARSSSARGARPIARCSRWSTICTVTTASVIRRGAS